MEQNMKANPKLMEEYNNIFDSEDKIAQAIKVTTEEFTIDEG